MKHTNYWLICSLLLAIQACQTQKRDEEATPEDINQNIEITDKETDNQIDISLEGRIFVYGLGCHWDSQSLTTGELSFSKGGQFKFRLQRGLTHDESDEFPEFTDKFEVLEGKYTQSVDKGEVKFNFEKYRFKNIQHIEEFDVATFQEGAVPIPQLTARLDSCEDKIKLLFEPSNQLIPQEKYFQWVEKNHSGTYVSYAEGVREELIIDGLGKDISISYLSPSYKKSVLLEIREYQPQYDSYKVNFPTDPKRVYELILHENSLMSDSQPFMKITNQFIDDPKDLSLSIMEKNRNYPGTISTPNLDTIVPYQKNKKIRFSKTSQVEFKQYFQELEFYLYKDKKCSPLKEDKQKNACLREIEEDFLSKNPDVRREGDILIFQLENNKQHFLKTHEQFGHPQYFEYHGYVNTPYGKVSYALGSFWEWGNYHIIHHQSGEEAQVNGTPYFSPDYRYFINSRNFHIEPFGTTFQIWAIKAHGFDLLWEFTPNYFTENFAWIDQNTIVFNIKVFGADEKTRYGKLEIIN